MRAVTPVDLDRLAAEDRVRLVAEVAATYLRVRAWMRGDDAAAAVAKLRAACREDDSGRAPAGAELVTAWRLARATRRTLELVPADSRCLYRSLTLLGMLERRAIHGVLVVAVRPTPFAAHAWVEVEEQAVLPVADPGYERILEL